MPAATQEQTGLGNYFVANYPPFSAWTAAHVPAALAALNHAPAAGTPLGLYLHIPFCRKRCKFCYFRVYTDKNADDVATYSRALVTEVELYSRTEAVGGRALEFVYFGGGTPSYLSATQLGSLMTRLQKLLPWHAAREVTFECEPGTLQQHKLATLKQLGVTRLSLGIENFKPEILEFNGRAHSEAEIYRAYDWARDLGFDQINIDLIAGMVGEDWTNWRECIRKTIRLAPESVTIYQMELPYNTTFSKELLNHDKAPSERTPLDLLHPSDIADWPTKRAWVRYAFDELAAAGYEPSSAYTMVHPKRDRKMEFVYRDSLWHGADMFGTGVASFGHVGGVHMQNEDRWDAYVGRLLQNGELPLHRALPITDRQRLIREMILQLKTGRIETGYFQRKFGVDVLNEFSDAWRELESEGVLTIDGESVRVTPDGLLQIDRKLPAFFEEPYRGARYT
jgi:oxygen-independent coproporphyrinogen-3 oxidase